MNRIAAHGLAVTLPRGWEARVRQRASHDVRAQTFPVLHAATFPLPDDRDDFGGNLTSRMRSSDAFVVLFEYGPDAVDKPLFGTRGAPRLTASMFSPNRLQRRRPGQVGCQLFFQTSERAFCCYVVAGSRASLPSIISHVNALLAGLVVEVPAR
jgi:hypothetical protein